MILSTRAKNCLSMELRVRNIGDLTPHYVIENSTYEQLKSAHNLGAKTLKEIEEWLACHGLVLRGTPPRKRARTESTYFVLYKGAILKDVDGNTFVLRENAKVVGTASPRNDVGAIDNQNPIA